MSTEKVYRGRKLNEISFPLGGIGTGCVGLAGNGRLVDWEIFNRPAKGGMNGFSHFAIKAEQDGKVLDARVLHGDLPPPYSGGGKTPFGGFGFGATRETMSGLPHFRDVSFRGGYPFAELSFREAAFPGAVTMTAFNPFIPLNDRDSSIPAALFEVAVTNPGDRPVDYTLAFTLYNPFKSSGLNEFRRDGELAMVRAVSSLPADALGAGDLTLATDAAASGVSFQEYWYRGRWFDNVGIYWRDFTAPGPFVNRNYPRIDNSEAMRTMLADYQKLVPEPLVQPGDPRSAEGFLPDPGRRGFTTGWEAAGFDDAAWPKIAVPGFWEATGLFIDGAVWFRRTIEVPEDWAGRDLVLDLGAIDDFDVTWFNGEQVGATGKETLCPWLEPRRYGIPGRLVEAGRNVIAIRVFDQLNNGGFAGKPESLRLSRADGRGTPLPLAGPWRHAVELAVLTPSGGAVNAQDHATLAARITVAPGTTGKVRFVLSWNLPNASNYWKPFKPAPQAAGTACDCAGGCCGGEPKSNSWKNYYVALFPDAAASAGYVLRNWDRLERETRRFHRALFGSTLPAPVLDAVSANISILKTPTCLRLTDGSFYGFEGCSCEGGCCEGSCTHVWNYAQALPFLFPALERSMRDLNYRHNQRADGGMVFRLQLPLGRAKTDFRPCTDGQFGDVIKTYRDWKISGDTVWLRSLWPAVKKSLEFAWAPTNADRWDADKSGVLTGRQHHTLDMELFGPNAWLTGFYLAALKAGAEMAEACGDPVAAQEFHALFAKGRDWVDQNLFNGEYFIQKIALDDKRLLEPFASTLSPTPGGEVFDTYWDAEHGELKYQFGDGCIIDQLLAQWHADLCGLGDIFAPDKTRSALASIYKYNFKKSMRNFYNPCRLYCLDDEAGTVIADWPAGKRKPVVPAPYTEETFHGCEYQVASHMILRGLVDEGVELVKAVRDRYDGERRNPWNEIECGSNYARSMASYALLNAFSGFRFDLTTGMLGFQPVRFPAKGAFRCFWALGSGWGEVEIGEGRMTLKLHGGQLELRTLRLPFLAEKAAMIAAVCGRRAAACELRTGGDVVFAPAVTLAAGQALQVTWS